VAEEFEEPEEDEYALEDPGAPPDSFGWADLALDAVHNARFHRANVCASLAIVAAICEAICREAP
jgi:hypothetical protein